MSRMSLQEYESIGGCEGCQFYGIIDVDGHKGCSFPFFDDDADEWEYDRNCLEIAY